MEKIPQLSNFEKAAVFLFVMHSVDSCYLLKILSHRFQIQEVLPGTLPIFFLCWCCLKNLILLMKVWFRLCYEL